MPLGLTAAFVIDVDKFVFTKIPLAAYPESLKEPQCQHSHGQLLILYPLTFDSNFTSSSIILCVFLFCTFISVGQFPLLVIHVWSMSLVLSLGDKKSAQLLALLSVQELITDVQWVCTNRLWKKRCDRSQIKVSICDKRSGLCTEELAAEFVFDVGAHN